MDETSKFRLTGAAIWLLLLVIVVPSWYSNPVNFNPDNEMALESQSTQPVVYQQYVLPEKDKSVDDALSFSPPVVVKETVSRSETVVKMNKLEVVETENTEQKIVPLTATVASKDSSYEPKAGEWLLKVYASQDIKEANRVLGLLDDKYEVWIKEFPKSKSFSVRTGPYKTRSAAERDKRKIDKAIRTHSVIVQVK